MNRQILRYFIFRLNVQRLERDAKLFTDAQLWNCNNTTDHIQTLWLRYKAEVSPNAKLYLFDLKGYGQAPLQILRNDVYLVAGWSDKVFEVLAALENGGTALDPINNIEL
jgi:60 kDa SS-A/Ro ribonucleoprotein